MAPDTYDGTAYFQKHKSQIKYMFAGLDEMLIPTEGTTMVKDLDSIPKSDSSSSVPVANHTDHKRITVRCDVIASL